MNKWKIGVVIAGAALLALGVGLFIFGLSLGASPVVAIGRNQNGVSSKRNMISGTVDIKEFDNIKVNVASIDVEFEKGDGYRIEYSTYEDNVPVVDQKGSKLTVSQPDNNNIYILSLDFSLKNDDRQVYKIIVPDDKTRYEIEMKATSGGVSIKDLDVKGEVGITSGDIDLQNVSSEDLALLATSGDINIEGSKIDKFDFKITSGSCNIKDCSFKDYKVKMSSGEIKIDDLTCDNAYFKLTSGDIKAVFAGNEEDYAYDIDMTSGDVRIAGSKFEGDYKKNNNTGKEIKIEMTSGSADIDFK